MNDKSVGDAMTLMELLQDSLTLVLRVDLDLR